MDLWGAGEHFSEFDAEGTILWRRLEGVVGCDRVPVYVSR